MLKRDFAILILSASAVYFALNGERSFSFRKAWCVSCPFKAPPPPPAYPLFFSTVLATCPPAAQPCSSTVGNGCGRYHHLDEDFGLLSESDVLPYPVVVSCPDYGAVHAGAL